MAHNDEWGLVHSLAMTLRLVILHYTAMQTGDCHEIAKHLLCHECRMGYFSICSDVNEATQMNVPIHDLHPRLVLSAADMTDCA